MHYAREMFKAILEPGKKPADEGRGGTDGDAAAPPDAGRSSPRMVAFVDFRALSAGAMIAYAHHEIHVTEGASIGDIGVIYRGPDGKIEYAPEKIETVVRTLLSQAAERRGWPRGPLLKMTARNQNLYRITPLGGEPVYVIEDDFAAWLADHPEVDREDSSQVIVYRGARSAPHPDRTRGGFARHGNRPCRRTARALRTPRHRPRRGHRPAARSRGADRDVARKHRADPDGARARAPLFRAEHAGSRDLGPPRGRVREPLPLRAVLPRPRRALRGRSDGPRARAHRGRAPAAARRRSARGRGRDLSVRRGDPCVPAQRAGPRPERSQLPVGAPRREPERRDGAGDGRPRAPARVQGRAARREAAVTAHRRGRDRRHERRPRTVPGRSGGPGGGHAASGRDGGDRPRPPQRASRARRLDRGGEPVEVVAAELGELVVRASGSGGRSTPPG